MVFDSKLDVVGTFIDWAYQMGHFLKIFSIKCYMGKLNEKSRKIQQNLQNNEIDFVFSIVIQKEIKTQRLEFFIEYYIILSY